MSQNWLFAINIISYIAIGYSCYRLGFIRGEIKQLKINNEHMDEILASLKKSLNIKDNYKYPKIVPIKKDTE